MKSLDYARFPFLVVALVLGACDNRTDFSGTGVVGSGSGGLGGSGGGGGGGGPGVTTEPNMQYGPDEMVGFGGIKIAGDAGEIIFVDEGNPLGTNPDGAWQLFSYNIGSGTVTQITDGSMAAVPALFDFDLTDNGDSVVWASSEDFTGDNPNNQVNIFIGSTSGAGISQVTRIDAGSAFNPQVSGTGVVVFVSDTDLTGDNPNNEIQIFSINVNGSNLTQVTSQRLVPNNIALSDNGQRIAFEGIGDPFGTNADGSWEIFVIDIDGSNLAQISMSDGSSYAPKISDDGSLVVFTSREDLTGGNVDGNYEVFVARSDGTGILQISDGDRDSGTFESGGPGDFDIAGNGSFVAFGSVANLTGENPDTEHTLFWAPAGGGPFAQFLREGTIAAGSLGRRANQVSMTNDGGGIAFESTQNYTSTAQPGNDKIYTTIRQ